MYLRRINKDERDREKPRIWRAAIYLCEPESDKDGGSQDALSIREQRDFCRSQAAMLHAQLVDEFLEEQPYVSLRPVLHQALEFAQLQRLDYLIVSSLDLLANNPEDFLEVGWRLGHAGTIPMPAGEDR